MRDQGHYFPFPVGQGFHPDGGQSVRGPGDELADQTAGDRGGEQGVPARDHAQRLQQLGRLGVLEQESARARPQGLEDVLVQPEIREDHDAHIVEPLVGDDLPGGFQPVQDGHLDVHQRDVRVVLGRQRDRLPPVSGLGDDLDVVFRLEQRADAAADQHLIVGQQDPDQASGRQCWARAGSSARTWKPP